MKCPYCGNEEDKVLESRGIDNSTAIRRRRECLSCQQRFTSYERIEIEPILVIKKDQRREPFDRDKIYNGILRACEKRPVSVAQMQNVVSEIEKSIVDDMKRETTSLEIGERVMEKLKGLDQVAYIRFASVYRQFKDITEFLNEIQSHFKQAR